MRDIISVVIPCYNQGHYLGEAIQSVLAQTYPHFEIIVVDDGSIDNTPEIASSYSSVRYIRQKNKGVSSARNIGIGISKGDYVIFLDADDRLLPRAMEVGLAELHANPESVFVSGHMRLISSTGDTLPTPEQASVSGEHYYALLCGDYIGGTATVLYRKEVFKSVGGFNRILKNRQDFELYLRIAREFKVCCHKEVVAEYRLHSTNRSKNAALMLKYGRAVYRLQYEHIKDNKQYIEAYRIGIKGDRLFYGEQMTREFVTNLNTRKWKVAVRDVLSLLRYYPRGFVKSLLPTMYSTFYKMTDIAWNFNRRLIRLIFRKSIGSIYASPNPIRRGDKSGAGATTLAWSASAAKEVEIRVGSPDGPLFSRGKPSGTKTTGEWVADGMVFYLQDTSGGQPPNSANTLARITVVVCGDQNSCDRSS